MHARADVPEHDADLPRRHPAAAVAPDWAGAHALPRVSAPTGTGIRAVSPQAALALQRTAGNRATGRLLSAAPSPAAVMSVMSGVQRDDDDPPSVASPLRSTVKLLPAPLWLSDPAPFLRDRPSLAPQGGLPLLPPAGVQGLIDWGTMGAAYRDRKLTLEDRDRSLVIGHWQRWYPVAQALYGLPLARSLFASPAAIMNTMSAKMIDSSLAGDQPNAVEQFNRQAEQFGVKTTTVGVTIGHF
jgi:hypothetical protein